MIRKRAQLTRIVRDVQMRSTPTAGNGVGRGLSRRGFLALGGAAAGTALLPGCGRAEAETPASNRPTASVSGPRQRLPKNIVWMVADGMSMGVPSLAEPFSQVTRDRDTRWQQLLKSPSTVHGLLRTHSLSGLVTDSAAAASAWGSGRQVLNGTLNMLPDGTRLTPLAIMAKDAGKRVGLVTTDTITGATPSGFAAVQAKRSEYDQIAVQFLEAVDVLMGGGRERFDALGRQDRQDLIGLFKTRGYQFMGERSQLLAANPAAKLLGLFDEGTLPYTVDQMNDADTRKTVPTLAEMTRHALASLAAEDRGFFLMVEGARVDHAAHNNDAGAILWEQLAFDDAAGVALDFAAERDDTLVVLTSDHGNGNPGLNGMGSGYSESSACFEKLAMTKGSFGTIRSAIKNAAKNDDPAAATQREIEKLTGIATTMDEANVIARAILNGDAGGEVYRHHQKWTGLLGQVLGNYQGIGWTSLSHTADFVMLSAVGPAAEEFAGLRHHIDAHDLIVKLLGIKKTATISAS